MELQKALNLLKEESSIFPHYAYQTPKQRDAYLFYHLCMNKWLIDLDIYAHRRQALHFLKRFKSLMKSY